MSLLGIDYGSQRVGLAVDDNGRAVRWKTVSNDEILLDMLTTFINERAVTTVVVGLPRNLDGDDTRQTQLVREFAESLAARNPRVTVELQDEADTSNIARQRLTLSFSEKEIEKLVDAEAAAIILEDYMHE